ncbi:MAG TPA: hypothetical protein VK557_10640 [Pyrinomonadaceae bacterium]|nr:hypothetical protein [Pyrinomonadaceae bacterium]
MFQLFDLIMTSPIGVFIAGVAQDMIYAALVVSDCDECGFNDLDKLLFGGILAAIIVGVLVSILVRRAQKSRGGESQFVSINATRRDE